MVLGVLCLCVVGEAAASTTAHIISFLQLFFSAFAAIYTIIPFHFAQLFGAGITKEYTPTMEG